MPKKQTAVSGMANPWYPEGGPGRHLKARLAAGDILVGPMITQYARPSVVKFFQHAGFDFVFVEYEHVYFGLAEMSDTILSARDNGLPVIAKTPQLERAEIAKLQESGVVGIQLPRTETLDEVETLIDYMKFPPRGTRAVAPGWANSDFRYNEDWPAWMDEQDQESVVVLHLETHKAYRDAEKLLSVDDIDMVYCGPGDSSVELGHPGDYDHPDVRGPMEEVLRICQDRGIYFGTTPSGPDAAARWVDKGASFFLMGSDMSFIRQGGEQLMNELKVALGE